MPSPVYDFSQRATIANAVLRGIAAKTRQRHIEEIVFESLGRRRDFYSFKEASHSQGTIDPFYLLFRAIGEREKSNAVNTVSQYLGYGCGVREEIFAPLTKALKAEAEIPFCARDIAEPIPYQGDLPAWWIANGLERDDAHPLRASPLGDQTVRLYAYPYMRDLLQANQEWFTAAQLEHKITQPVPPSPTILRAILFDAHWHYKNCHGHSHYPKPGTNPFEIADRYFAPDLWPKNQLQDMRAVRLAITQVRDEVMAKGHPSQVAEFIEEWIDHTHGQLRSSLHVVRTENPQLAAQGGPA